MILYIGNKLSKHGVNPTTIDTLGPLLEKEGFIIKYASDKKNILFRYLDMVIMVVKYHKKLEYVLIDTYSTLNYWYAFSISFLATIFGIPYIPIIHGGEFHQRIEKSKITSKYLLNKAYKVVFPSKYMESKISKYVDNYIIIPNSIDMGYYKYTERKCVNPSLLWVRTFASLYNPMMAVKVVRDLKKRYENVKLIMIGGDRDGSLSEVVKYAKEINVVDNIEFTGKLSKEDWLKKSVEADVFINTTNVDNTPVSVIEALALGLTVVSTDVGGIPFLLDHKKNALLVPKNDENAMTNSIIRLIESNDLANKISINGRKKAEYFDWNNVKQYWIDLLNN